MTRFFDKLITQLNVMMQCLFTILLPAFEIFDLSQGFLLH